VNKLFTCKQQLIDTHRKIEFVDKLSQTGLTRIEVTSFVSPKWVPQLADSALVMKSIKRNPKVRYSVLTPNLKGFHSALDSAAQEVAIFGAASEAFTKKNINCTIDQSLKLFEEVVKEAKAAKLPIRGYVSCVVGCPYEGQIKPSQVTKVVEKLLEMGCYEVSLGDTIGIGNPKTMNALFKEVRQCVGGNMDSLAIHCHDTYGKCLVG
jgi:hydroxymethylglutaryl-CoA lyase